MIVFHKEFVHPNGCLYDDEPQRDHARLWHPLTGWHTWIEPPNTLRLIRMKSNRFHRTGRRGDEAAQRL